MRALAIFLTALALCSCGSDRWPGHGGDRSAYDYPVIGQRWNSASEKSLGTKQDVAQICQVIGQAQPEMRVLEIRWLSPTEVIVFADQNTGATLGEESFYCALEKKNRRWLFAAFYVGILS